MNDRKHTCPTCNIVFDALPPGGPIVCPLCHTELPPPVPSAAPPAARPKPFSWLAAAAGLIFLGGSIVLAVQHLAYFRDTPTSAAPEDRGSRIEDRESRVEGQGSKVEDRGPKIEDRGSRIEDRGSKTEGVVPPSSILHPRSSILDPPPSPPAPRGSGGLLDAIAALSAKPPAHPTVLAPTRAEIDRAIKRGAAYLKQHMQEVRLPCRYEGLAGLALLECDVPVDDPVVQRIATSLRRQVSTMTGTYELALAILFFDRLGEAGDSARIRTLAEVLAGGQTSDGAWTYNCPRVRPMSGPSRRAQGPLPWRPAAPPAVQPWWDNSNTQFGVLGLWVAQRHGRNTIVPLARAEKHYRDTQLADGGWSYAHGRPTSELANTCSALLGLAAGHGINSQVGRDARPLVGPRRENDKAVAAGLERLARFPLPCVLVDKGVMVGADARAEDFYALWSVERVATLYDLKTFNGRDWYAGVAYDIVHSQYEDGRWYRMHGEPIDSSFALLVLRRSDLLPDLTATVQGKAPVSPPWLGLRTAPIPNGQPLGPTGPTGTTTDRPPPLEGTIQKIGPEPAGPKSDPEHEKTKPEDK
jgi:hypothetical protein